MRRKIVHIVTRLDFGGAQQNTLYTAQHLDPSRFSAVVVAGSGGTMGIDPAALVPPVRVVVLPDLVREINPLRDLIALLQLVSFLTAERPDAVHTHSSKAGILGRLAARLARVPVVVHTFHGFGFHDRMRAPVKTLFVLLEKLAARLSTRLIFVSRANRDEAARLGIGEPAAYALIRSGVAIRALPAVPADARELRARFGVAPAAPLIVGVGNLKPQKNAGDFVRAAVRVLARRPEACFLFVGDGPQRPAIEAQIRDAGREGEIRLLGWRKDALELLAAADAFLLTSLWEGLPRALVEAMASGLPCVCYGVDGVLDVLKDGENGFTAAPGDWLTLADRLLELLGDPALRERTGRAARESIGPEFDIDEMVRRQEELLESLLPS